MKPLIDYIYKHKKEFSLIMGGDVLSHVEVYNDARTNYGYDFSPMFSKITPIIKSEDLAFCNQESLLGGEKIGLNGGEFKEIGEIPNPVFCSPYELGDAVVNSGFNLISLANNHVLDKGVRGIRNSIKYWKNKPVITSGSNLKETKPKIHRCNGIKYAYLSYTTRTNSIEIPDDKEYLVNLYSDERVKSDIEYIKPKVDCIIVSIHWGTEYQLGQIDSEQEHISNYLAELGVNLIIGHHPHVIQPIRKIGDTLVIYSLGNLLACQDGDVLMKRIGALVKVNIKKVGRKIIISTPNTELTYCYYDENHRNFQIIPFSQLTDEKLPNYKLILNKYKKYINYENTTTTT